MSNARNNDDTRKGLPAWIWRTRRAWAPVYLAVAVWLTGVVLHKRAGDVGWTHLGILPWHSVYAWILLLGVVQAFAVNAFVKDGTTRLVGNAVGWAYGVWLMFAHALAPWQSAVFYGWGIISAISAMLWWTNRNVEARVKAEKIVDQWPAVAKAVHLADARMIRSGFRTTANGGWEARIFGPPSKTIIDAVDAIAARMHLKRGRLEAHQTEDAHITKLVYEGEHVKPATTVLRDPNIVSITDSFLVGHRPNGTPVMFRMFLAGFGALHYLVAGTNGSGKSNFVNLLVAHVVKAFDAVAWFIDLKGGAESGAWTRSLGHQAIEKAQAVEMVEEIKAAVDVRGTLLRKLGMGKVWKPSREYPVIAVFIDEVAELTGDPDLERALKYLKSIARRARALGILLVFATQLPTNEAIGSTQIKAQFQYRLCFRMQRRGQAQHILNDYDSIDVSALPGPDDPGHLFAEEFEKEPFRLKSLFVPDEAIEELDRRYHLRQPEVDGETVAGMPVTYAGRNRDPLGELDPEQYRDAFERVGESVGDTGDTDGEPVGDTTGDDGEAGDYWRTLVVPVQARRTGDTGDATHEEDRMTEGRPARIGDDLDPDDIYDDEFPPMVPRRLSDLPKGEPEPEEPKLGDEAAVEAFFAVLDRATRDGKTASPAELATAATRSRATVHRWIDDFEQRAWIERVGTGAYKSTGGYKPPVGGAART